MIRRRFCPVFAALIFVLDLSELLFNHMDRNVPEILGCNQCDLNADDEEMYVCEGCSGTVHHFRMRVHEEKARFFERLSANLAEMIRASTDAINRYELRLYNAVVTYFRNKETRMTAIQLRRHNLIVSRANRISADHQLLDDELGRINTEVENINLGVTRARRALFQRLGGRRTFSWNRYDLALAEATFLEVVTENYPDA